MPCPYLEYRDTSPGESSSANASTGTTPTGGSFDEPRAFCAVVDAFVQPMRADICNDRYDLHHAAHCEIYRDHEQGTGDDTSASSAGDDEASR
jgi:hypothetical protein